MKLYDSSLRSKVDFEPVVPGKVTMYVCGPTVYDNIHIGNARTFLSFDIIRRWLVERGYDVTFAQNLTDVDDKIIKRANERGVAADEVSTQYANAFIEVMERFGIQEPDIRPRATQEIPAMIEMIETLIAGGHAYEAQGDVYFSVRSNKTYGEVSGRNIDDLLVGARIEAGEQKRDPLDFALWKAAKPGEPTWDSPWGPGRPGWHTECAAMVHRYLGMPIDIHGGGADLQFPHHENECAHAQCAWGGKFANHWMHTGMLLVDGEKMSKSLGNFFTLKDVLDEYPADALRLLMAQTHYRSPLDFSDARLKEAEKSLARLRSAQETLTNLEAMMNAGPTEESLALRAKVAELRESFLEAMRDDFNTALAISYWFALAKEINVYHKNITDAGIKPDGKLVAAFAATFAEMASIIGVLEKAAAPAAAEAGDSKEAELVEMLIAMRQDARKSKNYALADELRNKLGAIGIVLQDTPQGVKWSKQ